MKLIADSLSLFRIILTIPTVIAMTNHNFVLAFWLWMLAWATDLADGMFARNYGSLSEERGLDADGIADSVLAFTVGAAVPFVTDGLVRVVATVLLLAALGSAGLMVSRMSRRSPATRRIIAVNMVVFHGLYQVVGLSMWLGYVAYGWWMVAVLALVFFVTAGMLQRDKIDAWLDGRFV